METNNMDDILNIIGMGFPKTESQLKDFDSIYLDYKFKADPKKIDPKKILNKIREEQTVITKIDYHKRTVLAAEIVFKLRNEYTLGHLKLHKLIYLCQQTTNMKLHTNFLRQAMGPYDPKLMRSIDSQLSKHKWFKFTKGDFPQYKPLENIGGHKEWFERYFSEQLRDIDVLIDLFRKFKSDEIELIATLYQCWLDAISEKQLVNIETLSFRLYSWSIDKKKFKKEDISRAIEWMEEQGITPK